MGLGNRLINPQPLLAAQRQMCGIASARAARRARLLARERARADFLRLCSLGFSKYRSARICLMMPSLSIDFLSRLIAFSICSPFLTLTVITLDSPPDARLSPANRRRWSFPQNKFYKFITAAAFVSNAIKSRRGRSNGCQKRSPCASDGSTGRRNAPTRRRNPRHPHPPRLESCHLTRKS